MQNQTILKNENSNEYPKKLNGNPIEIEGDLPDNARAIKCIQYYNGYYYLGYNKSTAKYGPTWIIKHQPYPCHFFYDALVNEAATMRYLVLEDNDNGQLYLPGNDSYEGASPTIAVSSVSSDNTIALLGRRDSQSGELLVAAISYADLLIALENSKEMDYLVETGILPDDFSPPNADGSPHTTELSLAINREGTVALAVWAYAGRLYYSFGEIDPDSATINSWGNAIPLCLGDNQVLSEQTAFAVSYNPDSGNYRFVLVYRMFQSFQMLKGNVRFPSQELRNIKKYELTGLSGKSPSVALTQNRIYVLTFEKDDEIKTVCGDINISGDQHLQDGLPGRQPGVTIALDGSIALLFSPSKNSNALQVYQGTPSTTQEWAWSAEFEIDAGNVYNPIPSAIMADNGDWIVFYVADRVLDYVQRLKASGGSPGGILGISQYKESPSDWAAESFYRLPRTESKNEWRKYRTIPGNHCFYLKFFQGKLFAAIGRTQIGGSSLLRYDPQDPHEVTGELKNNWSNAMVFGEESNTWATCLYLLKQILYARGGHDRDKNCSYKYDQATKGFSVDNSAFLDFDGPKRIVELPDGGILYIKDNLYKLKSPDVKATIVHICKNCTPIDIYSAGHFVFVLLKDSDGYPRVYKILKDWSINVWIRIGHDQNGWDRAGFDPATASPSALGVRLQKGTEFELDWYVGCDNGAVWVDC